MNGIINTTMAAMFNSAGASVSNDQGEQGHLARDAMILTGIALASLVMIKRCFTRTVAPQAIPPLVGPVGQGLTHMVVAVPLQGDTAIKNSGITTKNLVIRMDPELGCLTLEGRGTDTPREVMTLHHVLNGDIQVERDNHD